MQKRLLWLRSTYQLSYSCYVVVQLCVLLTSRQLLYYLSAESLSLGRECSEAALSKGRVPIQHIKPTLYHNASSWGRLSKYQITIR